MLRIECVYFSVKQSSIQASCSDLFGLGESNKTTASPESKGIGQHDVFNSPLNLLTTLLPTSQSLILLFCHFEIKSRGNFIIV